MIRASLLFSSFKLRNTVSEIIRDIIKKRQEKKKSIKESIANLENLIVLYRSNGNTRALKRSEDILKKLKKILSEERT